MPGLPLADDGDMTRRVLFLTHRLPYPPDRGDRIRSFHLLRYLAQRFDVTVGCVSDEPVTEDQRQMLASLASQVAIEPIDRRWSAVRGGTALLTGRAVTPAMLYRKRLARRLLNWHSQMPFDAVLTFCTGMIGYSRDLLAAKHRPRHILDLVDVDSIKWTRYADGSHWPLRWVYRTESRRLSRIERGDDADAITVISEDERRAYHREIRINNRVQVVGNGVDLDYFTPLPDSQQPTIAFVGVLNYRPNVDGITWFAHHVLPRIRQRVPAARLLIVGRDPSASVTRLNDQPGVEVVGPVADVRTALAQAATVVAPLHMAPGVQNKVLEAMASQRAVVCTHAAAGGIDAQPGRHLLTADDPASFAHHVTRMLEDRPARQRLATAARQQVERHYNWAHVLTPMADLLRGQPSNPSWREAA